MLMAGKGGGIDYSKQYLTFEALESGTFTFTYGSDVEGDSTSVSYSLDGTNWNTLTNVSGQEVSITTPTINSGDKVYWKGINKRMGVGDATNKYSWFSSTGRFDVSGDLQSILYDENFEGQTNTQWGTAYCFHGLFVNCTKLVNAKDLLCNARFGNRSIYGRMFMGCSSLISTPIFADEFNKGVGANFTDDTFKEIYKDCVSLVNPNWQFPVVNPGRSVYYGMFQNTAVTEARFPDSSKPLGYNIFQSMYADCKNLVDVPAELPWTTLQSHCYDGLFADCISLTKAPRLPATNLEGSCYASMFSGCTSLVDVPDIRINSFDVASLAYMFMNCTSLVHCPIKSPMPSTLSNSCCRNLFEGCTSLVDVCDFPAENNAGICYYAMLKNTKVTYIKMLLLSISGNSITTNWVQGVPANGIFVKNINATWNDVGNNGVPSGWTIIYYDPAVDKYYTDQTRATECDDHGNPI